MTHKDCTKSGTKSQCENGGFFFDDSDRLKALVESVIQEIIDTEFSDYIGAEPYDRQAGRRDYHNGYKPRRLKTRVGEIELSIPQAHNESFRTQMFRRYQRSERAFLLSLQEMVIHGVSTRKVRKITEQLCGITFSRSMVSKLISELDNDIQVWLQRPLTG